MKIDVKELQKIIDSLVKENEECTKPTAYCNGYGNALVDLVERLNKEL